MNPNVGFIFQAKEFYSRISLSYDEFKYKPKVYSVGLLNPAYDVIVCRYVSYTFNIYKRLAVNSYVMMENNLIIEEYILLFLTREFIFYLGLILIMHLKLNIK